MTGGVAPKTVTPKITYGVVLRAMEIFSSPKVETKAITTAQHMTAIVSSWLEAGWISESELNSDFEKVFEEATSRILLFRRLEYSPDIEDAKSLIRQTLGLPEKE